MILCGIDELHWSSQCVWCASSTRRSIILATREHRVAEFRQDPPPLGLPLQLLCEDKSGTYLLPFRCEWRNGAWYASEKTKPLEATVVGWREWRS